MTGGRAAPGGRLALHAALVAAGLGATGVVVGLAAGAGVQPVVVALPLAASLATSLVGIAALSRLRHRSLRLQILVTGLTATAAVVAGVLVTARAMFISDHDLALLGPLLLLSGGVATGAALWIGSAYERSVARVAAMARALTDTSRPVAAPAVATSELRALTDELSGAGAELAASRERERALEASRNDLVAAVSHDLRSPIAAIRAMAEALEDGVVSDPPTVAGYHRAVRQETERLGTLVDDLFELSRITAGARRPGPPDTPLDDVLAEVLDGAAPGARARGVRLEAALDGVPGVLAPASDLRRVLGNLLDNAVRHTAPGDRVTLAAGRRDGAVWLAVQDGCGGIPDGDLRHVFDVAWRGDAARPRDDGGGGLGLPIARGLVEAHHGSVDAVNVPGGCRFTVTLPLPPVAATPTG